MHKRFCATLIWINVRRVRCGRVPTQKIPLKSCSETITIPDHAARTQAVDRFAELVPHARGAIARSNQLVLQTKRLAASSRASLTESKRLLATMGHPVPPPTRVLHRWAVAATVAQALREVGFGCDPPKLPRLH